MVWCCRTVCLEGPQSKDGLSAFRSQNHSRASPGSDRTRWSCSVSLLCPSDLCTATTLSSVSVAFYTSSHQGRLILVGVGVMVNSGGRCFFWLVGVRVIVGL